MLRKFNRNPWFFLQYYAFTFILFAALDGVLFATRPANLFEFRFQNWDLLLIPAGIFVGIMSAALIHNATHGSLRPAWTNRFWGEICGVHQLYGFLGWSVAHLLHHKYPDDPERDPHPPDHLPFWKFALNMRLSLRRCLTHAYLQKWGDSVRSRRIWAAKNFFAASGMYVRLLFWFLLLGPVGFTAFYIPSLITNILFFAHFNYYTHRPTDDGKTVILNLNHSIYYHVVNRFFFGIYFHRNHHAHPSYANPRYAPDPANAESAASELAAEEKHKPPSRKRVAVTADADPGE